MGKHLSFQTQTFRLRMLYLLWIGWIQICLLGWKWKMLLWTQVNKSHLDP